jgi:hypothetical protein
VARATTHIGTRECDEPQSTGIGPALELEVRMHKLRSIFYGQMGQTTTEYATTLLVVLVVVGALTAFIKGGGFDDLFKSIIDQVKSGAKS